MNIHFKFNLHFILLKMKIIFICLSLASSFARFGNLRRKTFDNHHYTKNNIHRSNQRLAGSRKITTLGPLEMTNEDRDQKFAHDAASLAVINEMMQEFLN